MLEKIDVVQGEPQFLFYFAMAKKPTTAADRSRGQNSGRLDEPNRPKVTSHDEKSQKKPNHKHRKIDENHKNTT